MNYIEFGMPTLIELNKLEDCIALCHELNLSFIEINMNMPQYQLGSFTSADMKLAREKNIYFTIHLDENLNVCDFNHLVSKAYIDTVLGAIFAAKQMKIPVINMHMPNGVYFTLPEEKIYLFHQYREDYLFKLKEFRNKCDKAIGNDHIRICIENCDGYKDFVKDGINLLLESQVFGLTLDIGHNHSAGLVDQSFIEEHINRLHHMHIHDATGINNHMVLGTGEIDIYEKLILAKKNHCRCVIETKTIQGLKESVVYLEKHF